ncbi:MAG: PAS domain S-box protein [Microscillaceae bacterium]|nr:PAS domain S-box protein [Microscillaceae bacterium]
MEKVSESIATSLASVKNNEITHRLLLASQEQADTLRAQEEELRQNNEELLATQEEMQRRGNELSSQLETINRSGILLIEFNCEGLIQEANEAFYKRFAYPADQLLGKAHLLLAATSDHPARKEENFWLHLQEGFSKSGEYPFLTQNQDKCWIKGAYSPILDAQQKVHKIIFIGFDITEAKAQLEEIHQQALKLRTQESTLRQNNEELEQARLELEKKIEELNRFKAEEEKRLKERDAKAQVWVNKLMEKSKQQESLLKAQLAEKDQRIAELENQLIKLN